jgi:eukaryotic-like serine/threonine-protein kinase
VEHIDGPTLRRVVRERGGLDLRVVPLLALQLAGVLQLLARCGFVHLDVKPGNVVVTPHMATLIDLSLSRPIDAAASLQRAIGTPAYMAPEVCRLSGIGPAADIWSLGVTLYIAIEARRPFPTAPWDDLRPPEYPQVGRDPAPFQRELPAPLRDLVLSCLSQDPADRPTATDIVRALEADALETFR